MKILIVTDDWRPRVSGVVRVLDAHIDILKAQGHTVELIHPGQFLTVPLPTYPDIALALFPSSKMSALIGEFDPDAVHIATEGPLGWAARRICMRNSMPFTTWYHTNFQMYIDMRVPGLWWFVESMLKRFHTGAARTMVSTPSLKQCLEEGGFTNVVVVPLGVDVDRFKHSDKLPPYYSKPVYMYVGRLATEKSPEEFLQLDLEGTKLVIGDGPMRRELERKYPSAIFVGYKQGQELVDWISRGDVFVFPSRTETFGLVQLEAMACGIPVAAHDVMGPRDVITVGKDGYLSEDLAEAAKKCLSLKPTDCRQKAEQYSWKHSAEGLIKNLEFIK